MKHKSVYLTAICILFIGITIFRISGGMAGENDWKNWGEYNNAIDQYYLPAVLSGKTDDQRIENLEIYRNAWEHELTVYLNQYEARCNYEYDKRMVRDYLAAVHNHIEQSEKFLNSFNIDRETVLWFHIQAYRCAFIEHVRGVYNDEWKNIENESDILITNRFYQKAGGFGNPIDRKYLKILHSGGLNEAEFQWAQTNFMYSWGTDTEQLFKILFDSTDSDDITGYQESMDQWIDALNSRFWFTPEELNAADSGSGTFDSGMGTGSAVREGKGWILRLYALQLRTVLKNCPEIEVIESIE